MKRLFLASAAMAGLTLIGFAQDAPKPGNKPGAAAVDANAKTPAKGRLPAHFGKLGLSDPQKQQVYTVQSKYETQLAALEEQIAALRSQRDQEIEALLSPDQRAILGRIRKDVEDKRLKAKAAAASADPGKTEPAKE